MYTAKTVGLPCADVTFLYGHIPKTARYQQGNLKLKKNSI